MTNQAMKHYRNYSICQFAVLAVLTAMSFLLTATSVAATTIGASPANLGFSNLLRGGYAETSIMVSTDADDLLFGHLEVSGQVQSWVSFAPNQSKFNVTKNKQQEITVIIRPPSDVQTGTYSGKLTIVGDTSGNIAGRAGSIIKSSVTLSITVTITGTQSISCTAGGFEFADIETGSPLVISATVKNTGNVRLSPLITFLIWDSQQEKVIMKQEVRGKETLPTTTNRLLVSIPENLGISQYWADVSTPECNSKSLVTFSVTERGAITDKGELTELNTPAKAGIGEVVPITAIFYNQGKRVVTAQFKGTIKKANKIIQTISSEAVGVDALKVEKLQAFFTPKEAGTYTVSGRVLYNQKLTYEKSSNFAVEGEKKATTSFSPIIIYVIIVVTILFLMRRIREKKKRLARFR